jgi:NADH-quinone oxidoreductase subunit C/D
MARSLVVEEGLQNELAVPSVPQTARDEIPTFWIAKNDIHEAIRCLRFDVPDPYKLIYDVTAIDERARTHRDGQPSKDFTAVYHLYSFGRNDYVRLKVALEENDLMLPTITDIFPAANWYEREVWDMFGIVFEGHPHLTRILMPRTWIGHPLRKDHPARATEMGPFTLPPEKEDAEQAALQFHPEEWGMSRQREGSDFIFLNVGPQHPGTHGVLRIVLELDGEEIIDCVPEIGFHHRGAEKMGERQTWHTYIPYTDRVDYLGGVMNNFAYLTSVEKLAGITVPPRGQMIRVMMSELFRIMNHLVWYGTFAQDVGQMSPVFFMFNDREKALAIVEAICGARMHPNWFRIGGIAQDLPNGWDGMFRDFLKYMPPRMDEYERTVMRNRLFKVRTQGIGGCTVDEAIEWGMTGPNLRAAGLEWDFRKKKPYSCYDQLEFDIPIGSTGDCYDRAIVHIEEIRQSLRIIQQCVDQMPGGPCNADHPLAVPPPKARTMHDIETLINHFLGVSWGPVMPPGEAMVPIEGTKGNNGYYLTSDGSTSSYRTRIRTPSFAHMQMLPLLCRGRLIPDLLAVIGSLDYVLADIDR